MNNKFYTEFGISGASLPYAKLCGVEFFSTEAVFDCGQAFRFLPIEKTPHECEYGGVAFGKYISVAQDGDTLTIYGATEDDLEKIWIPYLGLDFDINTARSDILSRSDNPALREAVEYGKGIRILPEQFPAGMLTLPVGGFLVLGVLIAVMQWALSKSKK